MPRALLPELQRYKDTVGFGALGAEVQGPQQEQATQTFHCVFTQNRLVSINPNSIEKTRAPFDQTFRISYHFSAVHDNAEVNTVLVKLYLTDDPQKAVDFISSTEAPELEHEDVMSALESTKRHHAMALYHSKHR